MWTRAELKMQAKYHLKRYYWTALLVCFLTTLLAGGSVNFMGGVTGGVESSRNSSGSMTAGLDNDMLLAVVIVVFIILVIIMVLVSLFAIFVGNPVLVGEKRFFMESREMAAGDAGVGKIFYSFGGGKYWNTVKVMFLRDLFVTLWSLLLFIPGIIKSYQYFMVPYILAENPQIDYRDALQLSKAMMEGHKLNTWVLSLSFYGWMLLGAMACGLGIYFVLPYFEATFAELYVTLRSDIRTDLLPGFDNYAE